MGFVAACVAWVLVLRWLLAEVHRAERAAWMEHEAEQELRRKQKTPPASRADGATPRPAARSR